MVKHIGIIMDGNRRWAREHKMQALQGHEYVANELIEKLVERCIEKEIPYLTLWAFSTENWGRDKQEVEGLMGLFRQAFKKSAKRLHEKGVRLHVIGDLSKFPADIQENVADWLEKSKNNTRITVTFALNYGGRDEILRAVKKLVASGEEINQENIANHLDTTDMPDPDLIIRPGGEQRLSGFLPWQAVYAELYFTDILMPEFGPDQLDLALDEYEKRARRFGK
jgi:undecaprenyl diphosphate synthase